MLLRCRWSEKIRCRRFIRPARAETPRDLTESMARRTTCTFSCDIARAVSRRLRSRRERLAPTAPRLRAQAKKCVRAPRGSARITDESRTTGSGRKRDAPMPYPCTGRFGQRHCHRWSAATGLRTPVLRRSRRLRSQTRLLRACVPWSCSPPSLGSLDAERTLNECSTKAQFGRKVERQKGIARCARTPMAAQDSA
jgi:hypothetical protein